MGYQVGAFTDKSTINTLVHVFLVDVYIHSFLLHIYLRTAVCGIGIYMALVETASYLKSLT